MLARQLRYLLVPCQCRPYLGEPVGCIRHAQTCTTREHATLHLAAAHGLRHRLGIVGIIVGWVQFLWSHVDRLIAELLELVDKAILQVEPTMVGAPIDLFSHGCPLTPHT